MSGCELNLYKEYANESVTSQTNDCPFPCDTSNILCGISELICSEALLNDSLLNVIDSYYLGTIMLAEAQDNPALDDFATLFLLKLHKSYAHKDSRGYQIAFAQTKYYSVGLMYQRFLKASQVRGVSSWTENVYEWSLQNSTGSNCQVILEVLNEIELLQ